MGLAAYGECADGLVEGARDVGHRLAQAADAHRATRGAHFVGERLVQTRVARLAPDHEHRHVPSPGQQRPQAQRLRGTSHRSQEAVVGGRRPPLRDRDVVRSVQVVADGLGPGVRAAVVGAGEQVVHEFPAQPQLGLRQTAAVGQFQRQCRARVFEGEHVGPARRAVGVDERDDAEYLTVMAGQSDEASLVADRAQLAHRVMHELLAPERIGLGVGLGRHRPLLGQEVSEAVLDTGGEAGQLVHGGRDAVLPLVGDGGPGEDVVHGALPLQLGHQRGEPFVDRVPLLDRPEQLPGVLAVTAAGLGVVERGAGRLGKGVDEEAVLVGRRFPRADQQVAEQAA